mgnify:CR=1 FL=1
MPNVRLGFEQGGAYLVLACVLGALTFALLAFELRVRKAGFASFATGTLGVLCVLLAIVRPVRVSSRDTSVGAKVVLLLDDSRSMALKDDGALRAKVRDEARKEVEAALAERVASGELKEQQVSDALEAITKKAMRSRVLEQGIRPDGRGCCVSASVIHRPSTRQRRSAGVVEKIGPGCVHARVGR